VLKQVSNPQFDDYYVAPASTATNCNGSNGSGASRNISHKLVKSYNSRIIASGGGTTPSILNTKRHFVTVVPFCRRLFSLSKNKIKQAETHATSFVNIWNLDRREQKM